MKCPVCACQRFYAKHPEDEYETLGFDCSSGDICFDPDVEAADTPELTGDLRIYCDQCAWNGCLDEIRSSLM